MQNKEYLLIGIDGGATKVSGWIIDYSPKMKTYTLADHHADLPYASIDGFIPDFNPVEIPIQIAQRDNANIILTKEEISHGNSYIEATALVIQSLAKLYTDRPVLVGIGMPGLKTADHRGINVIANGPRMIQYCDSLEEKLDNDGISLKAPIARLGSDADYCGLGEFYADDGSFKGINNAYYLGGGTGAADAMLLKGKLIPFDHIKSWIAKTWEMKNDHNLSLERYASASGLQFIYSRFSGKSVDQLNQDGIFPPQIAERAVSGEETASDTYEEVAYYLAQLIFERISTLFCGSKKVFSFVNPNRQSLEPVHMYRGEIFDRIVIGQRLGELMASHNGQQVLTKPLFSNLTSIIRSGDCLPEKAKAQYLKGKHFNKDKIVFSKLREAPALGAGIDAHLAASSK